VRETEIRNLEVDLDRGILKINGEKFKERPCVVTLPGPEERFPCLKLFNGELLGGREEECDRVVITYEDHGKGR
jgi:hypothetical protein